MILKIFVYDQTLLYWGDLYNFLYFNDKNFDYYIFSVAAILKQFT